MQLITRRTLAAAAVTLAAGLAPRKPHAQTILTPQEPKVELYGIDHLEPLQPPAPPAATSFSDRDGKPVTLADFAGKGVVLNMWATWCTPCVAEMPALDQLATALAASNIVVVPISSDRGGTKVVEKFYAAHDVKNLGIWTDAHGVAARAWGARGLPTTLIIDRQGRALARLEGGAEWATQEAIQKIKALIG
jgi:thiol-disulfide isomerase/thioredoxin